MYIYILISYIEFQKMNFIYEIINLPILLICFSEHILFLSNRIGEIPFKINFIAY